MLSGSARYDPKMTKSGRQEKSRVSRSSKTEVERDDDDVDALFKLPLAEFTGARNELAARLKKSGREEEKAEAARVKALAKPSISAWAVNQLYWNHREAFDQLIVSGERFHKAQTSRSAGKVADIRAALDARREALTDLSDLATSVLADAGHNPAPDTIRRITTTLEGISAYASRSDAPRPGRLTADVDPPGFESFGSFAGAAMEKQQAGGAKQAVGSKQAAGGGKQATRITQSRDNKRQLEDDRKSKIAAARISLQDAKRSLTEARATAKSLETEEKKALAYAKEAEKNRRDAEERLEKATTASKHAAQRARNIAGEVEEAASAIEDAERKVNEAMQELEKSFAE